MAYVLANLNVAIPGEYTFRLASDDGSELLPPPTWAGTEVVSGDLATVIQRLKAQDGRPLLVRGGASFARDLIGLGLVDEYRLLQHPIALAAG